VLTTTRLLRKRLDLARRFDPKLIVDFGSDVSVTLIEAVNRRRPSLAADSRILAVAIAW